MATIIIPNGKQYDTNMIDTNYDPFFCKTCGKRMGWYNVDYNDQSPAVICEDCIAEMQED